MKAGAWQAYPSFAHARRMNTFIDFSVLERWHVTAMHSPETSVGAFLKCVGSESASHGNIDGIGNIDEVTFHRAYTEWRYLQKELRVNYGKLPQHVCPAEHNGYHCTIVDGNMKVSNCLFWLSSLV